MPFNTAMIAVTLLDWLGNILRENGASVSLSARIAIALGGLAFVAYLAFFLTKAILRRVVEAFIMRSKFTWDDHLVRSKFLFWFSQLVPGILVYACTPFALEGQPGWIEGVQSVSVIYMLTVGYLSLNALLNGAIEIYRGYPISREIPIRGFVQVAKIILTVMLIIVVVSMLLDKSPFYLLSGLGALTAVLMLIFKDSILGLVAGIQLAANRMVARGDWIAMPKFGADGSVLEVALTTVKVQNFDNTVTTIPTYALISDSFKNWRGMQESGGRRIKRALHIDVGSIKFADETMLEKWSKFRLLKPYLRERRREIAEYNKEQKIATTSPINGRHLTNIGTFRAYIQAYLENHPMIAQNLTLLVRQLAPTEHGLPLEVYVFSKNKNWVQYEGIQADIFDHLFAVLPEFHLRAFQRPAGADLSRWLAPQTDPRSADIKE